MLLYTALFFLCLLAFGLSAICGGGASMVLIPLLSQVVPISQVPLAISLGTFGSSASRLVSFKRNVRWDIVKFFVPAALPAVWLGAYLLKFINPVFLQIIIGVFLISNIPALFVKDKSQSKANGVKKYSLMLTGFFAGFLSGLTGAVGLLFNKFYLKAGMAKEEIVATRAANEIILHLLKICLYIFFGLFSAQAITVGFIVAAAAITSTIVIKKILPFISQATFQKIGYSAMVISGFFILQQSFNELQQNNFSYVATKKGNEGFETQMSWQHKLVSLEFSYDEGFEIEQQIPITELSQTQKEFVLSNKMDADRIMVEVVHSVEEKSFEAYYYADNKLIDKKEFK